MSKNQPTAPQRLQPTLNFPAGRLNLRLAGGSWELGDSVAIETFQTLRGFGRMTLPARLGVVDDHEAIRIGIVAAVHVDARTAPEPIRVTRAVETVDSLIAGGPAVCQVVALDLSLADGSHPGFNVHRLREQGCQVVVYSLADDPDALRDALSAGAAGYVRKGEPLSKLLDMVRDVHAGRAVICREFAAVVDDDPDFARSALTEKERQAVGLYASGLSIEATAVKMHCSPATAKTFVDRAKAKYQAQDRPASQKVHLFINAIQDRILPPIIPRAR